MIDLQRLNTALTGRYRVERELGAGGMATVYLAHDARHDRRVALKVLRPDLSAVIGAERFLQEIKTTANLQHPHILALFDSGEVDGTVFYVMPLVEGESLRDRLHRDKQLPVDEAVRIAREVADALDYAHRHGVVHRDIKPENILLHDGRAVVADFGIALAVSRSEGGTRMTETGLSLGTPHYMSPEQAMGQREITARSDVYALGCVLYEMLAGEPPFTGPTPQAIVARVVTEQPRSLAAQRHTIPLHVEAAVRRALEKLPADRFQSAAQFAEALVTPSAAAASSATTMIAAAGSGAQGPLQWTRRMWIPWAVAGGLLVTSVGLVAALWQRNGEQGAPLMYDQVLPDSAPISFTKGSPWGEGWTALAVSPRGDFVVYIADRGSRTELWYRSLLDSAARPFPGTEGAYQLALSPDGDAVAFIAGSRLKLASVGGGGVRELGQVTRPRGLAWASAERVVLDQNEGLHEFDRIGGTPLKRSSRLCTTPSPASAALVLCGSSRGIYAVDLNRDVRMLLETRGEVGSPPRHVAAGTMPVLVGDHFLVYSASDGTVIAAPWHANDTTLGKGTMVLSGVRTEGQSNPRQAVVSASGTLVFVPGLANAKGQFVRSGGTGDPVALPIPPVFGEQFDLSPDGARLAVTQQVPGGVEVWVYDMASGLGTRWISGHWLVDPRWNPDGRRLAVRAFRDVRDEEGAVIIGSPLDGSRADTVRGLVFNPSHWYRDDRILIAMGSAVLDVQLGVAAAADTLVQTSGAASRPVMSRDGRFVAVMEDDQVVVHALRGRRTRSVLGRGIDPLWLDDRTVMFKDGWTWFRSRVREDGSADGRPRAWFSDSLFIDTDNRSHVLTNSGEVIYLRSLAPQSSPYLRVIPHWDRMVERAVRAANPR